MAYRFMKLMIHRNREGEPLLGTSDYSYLIEPFNCVLYKIWSHQLRYKPIQSSWHTLSCIEFVITYLDRNQKNIKEKTHCCNLFTSYQILIPLAFDNIYQAVAKQGLVFKYFNFLVLLYISLWTVAKSCHISFDVCLLV